MVEQASKSATGTTQTSSQTQSIQELTLILPYIGDTIYTNVRDALADIATEKEFNDNFNAQHERNLRAARGDTQPGHVDNPKTTPDMSSTAMLMFASLMRPISENSYMAKLLEPVPATARDSAQPNASEHNSNRNAHRMSTGAIQGVEPTFYGSGNISSSPINIHIPGNLASDIDHMNATKAKYTAGWMRKFNTFSQFVGTDKTSESSSADQNLNRDLRNEQFKNIGFENRVRKPKDELLLKFLRKWDSGEIKFDGNGAIGTNATDNTSVLPKTLAILGIGIGLHAAFGVAGDAMMSLIGQGLQKTGNTISKAASRVGAFGKQFNKNLSKVTAKYFQNVTKLGTKLGNSATKLSSTVTKMTNTLGPKFGSSIAKHASSLSKYTNILSKSGMALGKSIAGTGKMFGAVGAVVGAATTGYDVYQKWQSGDKAGAVTRGIGGAFDVATNFTGVGAGFNLLLSMGTKALKKFGVVDADTPESTGEWLTSLLDNGRKAYNGLKEHSKDMDEQKSNLNRMMSDSTSRLLRSRARAAVKRNPAFGDADMVVDKFLSTDQATEALDKLKDANEHYVSANGVGGRFLNMFGGDSSEEARAKMNDAQKAVFSLFDEYLSTYDPNKMHEWNFATQNRIAAEQETVDAVSAADTGSETSSGDGGNVSGVRDTLEAEHEYKPQMDAETMECAVASGTGAVLLDPRFHAQMRDDMAVIGQQINTQLTG